MSERLERACNILRWASENESGITKACSHFKVNRRYISNTKKDCVNHIGYNHFLNLFNKHVGIKATHQSVSDDLLSNSISINKNQTTFSEEEGNKGILDARGNAHVSSLSTLIEQAKIDLSEWTIDRHVVNKWDVTNAEGKTYQNWQIKAWLSKIKTDEEKKQWEFFLKTISDKAPRAIVNKHIKTKNTKKYLFELSLPDLHIGKLAWDKESGEDYDTKIAIGRYNEAIESLLEQVSHIKDQVEQILFPIGNDLINIDNKHNMTTAGTPQNVDSRWQQMFLKAKNLLIYNIDKLYKIAPVNVVMISGNHDQQTIFYLGEALKAWYHNNANVLIDNSPTQRKYYAYGVNLIGFTHGNEEKHQDLGLIMATEQPLMWATAKFRQIHLGHYHKKKEIKYVDSDEHQGFKVKILPSLSGTDAWHSTKGYIAGKGAVGMLYDSTRGMIAEYSFNVL